MRSVQTQLMHFSQHFSFLVLLFPLFLSIAGAAPEFSAQVDARFAKESVSCIMAPSSGAPAGTDEQNRRECETQLKAKIKSELSHSEIARLKVRICDPQCSPTDRNQLSATLAALVQANCEFVLPPALHKHIKSTLADANCSSESVKPFGGKAAAKVAAACGQQIFEGGTAQVKTVLEQAATLPGKIIAAPSQIFGTVGKVSVNFAKNGAQDTILKAHGDLAYGTEDVIAKAKAAVAQTSDLAAGIYACLPPEKAFDFACYIGGSTATSVAEGVIVSKGASLVLSLNQTQKLLQTAAELFDTRANLKTIRADAKALAAAEQTRRQLLQAAGPDPQNKIWNLRASGNYKEADAIEKAVVQELANSSSVEIGKPALGKTGALYVKTEAGLEGVWKAYEGHKRTDGNAEIAAYKTDKHLGWNNVPITAAHTHNGIPGTIQLRVKDLDPTAKFRLNSPRFAIFDYLIGNWDRNPGNYLRTNSGRTVAIDHGVAFDYDSKQVYVTNAFDKVLESVKNEKTRLLLLRNQYSQSGLPNVQSLIKDSEAKLARAKEDGAKSLRAYVGNRAQYEQLKAISPSDWPKIVGNEIASDKIEIMQKRHREIIKLVEESRAELGDQIFFPAP